MYCRKTHGKMQCSILSLVARKILYATWLKIYFEKGEMMSSRKLNTIKKTFSSFKILCMISYPKTLFLKNNNKIIQ